MHCNDTSSEIDHLAATDDTVDTADTVGTSDTDIAALYTSQINS
jgi:hypothetical protein